MIEPPRQHLVVIGKASLMNALCATTDDDKLTIGSEGRGFVSGPTGAKHKILVVEGDEVRIDLVFQKVQMTGDLDGLGQSHWLRMNKPDVPMIFTSAYAVAVEAKAVINEPWF